MDERVALEVADGGSRARCVLPPPMVSTPIANDAPAPTSRFWSQQVLRESSAQQSLLGLECRLESFSDPLDLRL